MRSTALSLVGDLLARLVCFVVGLSLVAVGVLMPLVADRGRELLGLLGPSTLTLGIQVLQEAYRARPCATAQSAHTARTPRGHSAYRARTPRGHSAYRARTPRGHSPSPKSAEVRRMLIRNPA